MKLREERDGKRRKEKKREERGEERGEVSWSIAGAHKYLPDGSISFISPTVPEGEWDVKVFRRLNSFDTKRLHKGKGREGNGRGMGVRRGRVGLGWVST